MLLSFRQGIVQYETDGFLTVTTDNVSLVVTDAPVIVTVAAGTTDYLWVEHQSVTNAWQITSPGIDQWLYWDIHTFNATRTFGITTVLPIVSSQEPQFPVTDQHWFDTTKGVMKVWQTNHWTEKLRVFACKLTNGAIAQSMSINAPAFNGTQVGDNSSIASGTIMYDSVTGKPLRAGNKFITTEDVLSTSPPTKSDVRTASLFVEGVAQVPMARYTVVTFTDFGELTYADTMSMAAGYQPTGIIQQDCIAGDVVTVVTSGIITAPDWDWSVAGINAPIYCNETGELTPHRTYTSQRPVGYVVDTNSLLIGTAGEGTAAAESAYALDDIIDVNIVTPVASQVLTYTGSVWSNSPIPTGITTLAGLSDVTLTAPTINQLLKYNGSDWINSDIPYIPAAINDLDDVSISTPTNGQYLTYQAGQWINTTPSTVTLDSISDVVITTPTTDQVLKYNGSQWVNEAPPANTLDGLSDVIITTPSTNHILKYNGSQWVNGSPPADSLDELSDVVITSPVTNHILKYNGSQWVNDVLPSGVIAWNSTSQSLYGPTAVTGGSLNTTYGNQTLAGNITGIGNVAVGFESLATGTTPTSNTAVGYKAMRANRGSNNVAVGYEAMLDSTTAGNNVAIGTQSQHHMSSGVYNITLGTQSLQASTDSWHTIAIGHQAMVSHTGDFNLAIGTSALSAAGAGHSNVAIGYQSSLSNQTGNSNVTIGNGAGYTNTTGSGNVFLGYNAGYNETGSNKLYISNSNTSTPLIYGDFSTPALTINGSLTVQGKLISTGSTNLGNITGATSLNATTTEFYYGTVTGNTTWSFTGTMTAGTIYSITLELTNPGAFTQTWPASVKWSGGVAPSYTAAGVDVLEFYTRDGGTTWRGFQSGKDMK